MNDVTTQETNRQLIGNLAPELGGHGLPPSLQILLNEGLYTRVKQLSALMANAQGMTPAHLIGKGEACFAIINMALDWKLNPHFVARHTYQTPGGQIGYDGALVQSILERSGRFEGAPQIEYRGDWTRLTGKFQVKTNAHGKPYVVPTWTAQDAVGLGVVVRWKVRGEGEPRVWPGENEPFWLTQCYPLNSPLWATDPKTQIAYLAIRRFANLTSPGILGAASFDQDELLDASERAIDITPQPEPRRGDFVDQQREPESPRPKFPVWTLDGEEQLFGSAARARDALAAILSAAARVSESRLTGAWEDNNQLLTALADSCDSGFVSELAAMYADLLTETQARERKAQPPRRSSHRAADAPAGEGSPGRGGAQAEPAPGEPARGDSPTEPPGSAHTSEAPDPAERAPEPERPSDAPAPAATPTEIAEHLADEAIRHSEQEVRAAADDRFPGDLPPGQRLGDPPTTASRDAPQDIGQSGSTSEAGEPANGSSAGDGPTATSTASPSEHAGFVINPVLRSGKEDWKTWVIALFGPKVRQQRTTVDFARLLGANAEHLDRAKRTLSPADRKDLEGMIAQQWKLIEQLEGDGDG